MNPDPKQEGLAWLDQAQADVRQARDNAGLGHHNLACFVAQQAAEKTLKAVLYCAGSKRIMLHGVQEISKLVLKIASDFASVAGTAALLDKYYIATRYPNGLAGGVPYKAFGADDSSSALHAAEQVLQFAETAIHRLLSE